MLKNEIISRRLEEMKQHSDPSVSLWPENCAGSRRALVIFVGPSPGGKKDGIRIGIKSESNQPLWNKPYNDPLTWSRGFRHSFKPIVEEIFNGIPYEEASKLIARVNMDWASNPESYDVSLLYMWEGCKSILPVIYECDPELVIPMDEKTFGVLQIALYNDGYKITPPQIRKIKVEISNNKKTRYHTSIMAFTAKRNDRSFLVMKSLQHPARIFDVEYARRIGQAIRESAIQVWNEKIVDIDIVG